MGVDADPTAPARDDVRAKAEADVQVHAQVPAPGAGTAVQNAAPRARNGRSRSGGVTRRLSEHFREKLLGVDPYAKHTGRRFEPALGEMMKQYDLSGDDVRDMIDVYMLTSQWRFGHWQEPWCHFMYQKEDMIRRHRIVEENRRRNAPTREKALQCLQLRYDMSDGLLAFLTDREKAKYRANLERRAQEQADRERQREEQRQAEERAREAERQREAQERMALPA